MTQSVTFVAFLVCSVLAFAPLTTSVTCPQPPRHMWLFSSPYVEYNNGVFVRLTIVLTENLQSTNEWTDLVIMAFDGSHGTPVTMGMVDNIHSIVVNSTDLEFVNPYKAVVNMYMGYRSIAYQFCMITRTQCDSTNWICVPYSPQTIMPEVAPLPAAKGVTQLSAVMPTALDPRKGVVRFAPPGSSTPQTYTVFRAQAPALLGHQLRENSQLLAGSASTEVDALIQLKLTMDFTQVQATDWAVKISKDISQTLLVDERMIPTNRIAVFPGSVIVAITIVADPNLSTRVQDVVYQLLNSTSVQFSNTELLQYLEPNSITLCGPSQPCIGVSDSSSGGLATVTVVMLALLGGLVFIAVISCILMAVNKRRQRNKQRARRVNDIVRPIASSNVQFEKVNDPMDVVRLN